MTMKTRLARLETRAGITDHSFYFVEVEGEDGHETGYTCQDVRYTPAQWEAWKAANTQENDFFVLVYRTCAPYADQRPEAKP